MSNWWYATSVDVTNGSDLVRVNTGDDAKYFERGSCWLKIAGHEAVETDGLITDGADTFIRLVKDWAGETDTGRRAFAFRTVPDFQGVADKLALNIKASQEVVDNVISKMGTLLTSTDERVVIETPEGDVEVVPYGRLKADIEQQFNEFVDARQQQIDEATSKVDAANLEREFDDQCTLILDFARNRYEAYEGISSGNKERSTFADLVSFTRGSEKTGFDALGRLRTAGIDVPVFPWEVGDPKGILIEGQRTNLVRYSNNLTLSPWVDDAQQSPNANIYPSSDNLLGDVTTLDATSVTGEQRCGSSQSHSLTPETVYTASVILKNVSNCYGRLSLFEPGGLFSGSVSVNLTNGEIVGSTPSTYSVIKLGDGTYRVSITFIAPTGTSAFRTIVGVVNPTGQPQLNGDGGIMMATCVQLEQGLFPTSYIPTSETPLTRLADDCHIDDLQNQPWWNPNEGTFVVDAPKFAGASSASGYLFAVGNTQNGFGINTTTSNTLRIRLLKGGGANLYTLGNEADGGRPIKIALSYKNGVLIEVSTNGIITPVNGEFDFVNPMLAIGDSSGGTVAISSALYKSIKYAPIALTSEKLQILSQVNDND